MKNLETVKSKFLFLADVRDYLSTSMIIKNNHNKSNDSEHEMLFDKSISTSEKNKPFDLFAHILEG